MKTISAQEYRDEAIIQQKLEAQDFEVYVTPVFEVEGKEYRVVVDGHHSLEAAKLAGVDPVFVEMGGEHDAVDLINRGKIEDALEILRVDCDYYDIETGNFAF